MKGQDQTKLLHYSQNENILTDESHGRTTENQQNQVENYNEQVNELSNSLCREIFGVRFISIEILHMS